VGVEENKVLVRRLIEDVWNQGQLHLLDDMFAEGATLTVGGRTSPPGGPAQVKAVVAHWRTAFPDFHFELADLIAEGDRVVVRVPFTGTQTGRLMDIAPTGRSVRVGEVLILRIQDGKIVEGWEEYDEFGMRQQLGVTLPPGQPPATHSAAGNEPTARPPTIS
jgi:ketosteroid isomerase-like protein